MCRAQLFYTQEKGMADLTSGTPSDETIFMMQEDATKRIFAELKSLRTTATSLQNTVKELQSEKEAIADELRLTRSRLFPFTDQVSDATPANAAINPPLPSHAEKGQSKTLRALLEDDVECEHVSPLASDDDNVQANIAVPVNSPNDNPRESLTRKMNSSTRSQDTMTSHVHSKDTVSRANNVGHTTYSMRAAKTSTKSTPGRHTSHRKKTSGSPSVARALAAGDRRRHQIEWPIPTDDAFDAYHPQSSDTAEMHFSAYRKKLLHMQNHQDYLQKFIHTLSLGASTKQDKIHDLQKKLHDADLTIRDLKSKIDDQTIYNDALKSQVQILLEDFQAEQRDKERETRRANNLERDLHITKRQVRLMYYLFVWCSVRFIYTVISYHTCISSYISSLFLLCVTKLEQYQTKQMASLHERRMRALQNYGNEYQPLGNKHHHQTPPMEGEDVIDC